MITPQPELKNTKITCDCCHINTADLGDIPEEAVRENAEAIGWKYESDGLEISHVCLSCQTRTSPIED